MNPAKKRCPSCEKRLPFASFGRNACNPDGYATYCKNCNNEKQRKWKGEHSHKVRKWAKNYRDRMKHKNGAEA